MSGLLLERSLIQIAECPFCRTDVVLGDAHPREEVVAIGVWEQPNPVDTTMPRWWRCSHGPDYRGHVWETSGPIEIRPVMSVHVELVDPDRPLTVPAPADHTTSTAAHSGAATATTTAGRTPRPADDPAATDTAARTHAQHPTPRG